MSGVGIHARDGGGPAFDLLASKLRRPPTRPGTIRRASLIERLARETSRSIVSVVAPAGYGKTTLLAEWAECGGRAVAWVSVDEKDNDPKVLLTYVARALDAVQPVGRSIFDVLASPASSVPGSVVPRLGNAFFSMTVPVALILDDVHLLHSRQGRAALSTLAEHVPPGSQLVLAGRNEPPLRIARLRAEGRIMEIGPGDLALTRAEASLLLRAAQVVLDEDDVTKLHERTEGWPVGLYLAALYLREGGSMGSAVGSFGGGDRFVSDYMHSEFLEQIPPRQRLFLTRAAVLERMSGPLCEQVLDQPGSGPALAELARSNLLLVPLDRQGEWYRYHHLFRDMLLAELERHEPDLMPVLRRRAADWCLANDLAEEALEYSLAAEDTDTVARLVANLSGPVFWQGQYATVRRWFQWLQDRGGIEQHPAVTAQAALIAAATGQPADAERWADLADRWQEGNGLRPEDPVGAAWAAAARASLCRHGVRQMRADADEAVRRFAAANIVGTTPAHCQGLAHLLSGDFDGAGRWFEETIRLARESGSHQIHAEALAELAVLAMAQGDWDRAGDLADQAGTTLRQATLERLLVCAVQARVAVYRGDTAAAQQQLVLAQRLRPASTYAHPHAAVQARIELIHVHLALADISGAWTLMQEIDEVLSHRPDLGTLAGQAGGLRARLADERGASSPGASALTAAELRVLPLLATHLSYPEIAAELSLSPNTIKSQAYSLFRKLGASSRSQAVARSRELTLLDG